MAREPRGGIQPEIMFQSKGWQVASLDDNAIIDRSAFVPLTAMDESAVILNCYQPGQADEMHCHPKEEHTFLVWKGKLHLTGVEDGEELTLVPGQFVTIDANYYYRLHNPGPEPAVYCQFRTVPLRQPKRRMVPFSESARGKRAAAEAAKNS
ncbi:MAG TPA: cupin domain-containing protein [Chloroflexota bacterium]